MDKIQITPERIANNKVIPPSLNLFLAEKFKNKWRHTRAEDINASASKNVDKYKWGRMYFVPILNIVATKIPLNPKKNERATLKIAKDENSANKGIVINKDENEEIAKISKITSNLLSAITSNGKVLKKEKSLCFFL